MPEVGRKRQLFLLLNLPEIKGISFIAASTDYADNEDERDAVGLG